MPQQQVSRSPTSRLSPLPHPARLRLLRACVSWRKTRTRLTLLPPLLRQIQPLLLPPLLLLEHRPQLDLPLADPAEASGGAAVGVVSAVGLRVPQIRRKR